jgi:NADH-quinone oxidoreductase subunit A
MIKLLITPPIVFIILLVFILILNRLFSKLAYRSDKSKPECGKSYACGENNYDNMAQPDYSNFFPFAFFFTLAHVSTLIITTVPIIKAGALVMAAIYIMGGIVGLYVLLRK